ncbi:MAG: hypothetical protein DMG39_26375 [Acidobacteria bacterium]|nr:MAG: hypothetical protein DMG39_26375 [Acidobacteriota bacterium]
MGCRSQLPEVDPIDILADQIAQAVREADSEGRRCRVNPALRATKSGVQYTFWGVMGYAPHDHMEKAFAQRAIVGENDTGVNSKVPLAYPQLIAPEGGALRSAGRGSEGM